MKKLIAYCGLDCEKCDAYVATKNNDDELRKEVAKKWSELNSVEITPEMINCEGCRMGGKKTPYCQSYCEIRKCAAGKKNETCGDCSEMESCKTLKPIIEYNVVAYKNLKGE